ncbi:MAG: HEPN domain-containing protein [Leptolyngbyaceae cyanobacterium bins.302]|nr:HEPN domain-containing protein [Leptolyngbyaceae cyanobacterium bins.302]
MNQEPLNKLLNNLIKLISSIVEQESKIFPLSKTSYTLPIRSFRYESMSLSLQGYDIHNQMEDVVDQLWDFDQKIQQSVSRKIIEKKIIEMIFQYQQTTVEPTVNDLKKVLTELRDLDEQEWLVIRPVHGASLEGETSTKLGPFTLYTWDAYQALIASTDPSILNSCLQNAYECRRLDENYPSHFPLLENLGNIFISVKVVAHDSQRAIQLADERFNQFENVISYMLGQEARQFNFGVTDCPTLNGTEHLLMPIQTKGITYSSNLQDSLFRLELDSPFFRDGKIRIDEASENQLYVNFGHNWIWKTLELESSQVPDWHHRILSAVEWIGKGLRDKNSARSLVQFTFALEALFFYQKKGILVSPSIASTLAEFTAFIVGANCIERLDIIRKVNEIYEKRSAVAHGAKQSVSIISVSEALRLVKSLITQIITSSEFLTFQSINDLRDWVNERKYS